MGGDFFLMIIKLVLAVLLLPFISGVSLAYYSHLDSYPHIYEIAFLYGVAFFLFSFLFIYQFWRVYELGQKAMLALFRFAAPLDKFLANIFPFYLILTMVLFFVAKSMLDLHENDYLFMFFIGFFMTMHIVLVAQDLQSNDDTIIKPSYFLNILLVIFFVILIAVLGMDFIRSKWTFPDFYYETLRNSKILYRNFFKTLLFMK